MTLLVLECVPPSPSICMGSGVPMSSRSSASRSGPASGRSPERRNTPLLVPPRISVTRSALDPIGTPRYTAVFWPVNMDAHEVDVVVVGAGNAALVAALTAHQAGARVLVLEAAPEVERGGNSRFSGGIFRTAHDGLDHLAPLLDEESRQWLDRLACGPYPAERYLQDLQTTSAGQSDRELIELAVHRSYETVAWMHERGVQFELTVGKLVDPAKIPPGETYHLPPGGVLRAKHEGIGLMHDLFDAVERAGIDVWYDAPAHDLLVQGDTVQGVRVRRDDRYVDVHGAVVLAAGGFESSPAMRPQYLGAGWGLVKVRGTRFNTGTMLRRALDAGAQA